MSSLIIRSVGGIVFLLSAMALAIFMPAGTVHFWQGWALLAVFGGSAVAVSCYLLVRDPGLVERRTRSETRTVEKIIQGITGASFIAILLVAGFDHRFGWSQVPAAVAMLADAIVAASFWAIFLVLRENSFAASTIQVESKQRVISTGLYAHVRHPMYAGALPMLIAMPVAMGSWWGMLPVIPLFAGLVVRIFDEERVLAAELPGYDAYLRSVRWRLIPMVW